MLLTTAEYSEISSHTVLIVGLPDTSSAAAADILNCPHQFAVVVGFRAAVNPNLNLSSVVDQTLRVAGSSIDRCISVGSVKFGHESLPLAATDAGN